MCAKGLDAGEGYLVGAEKRDGETVFTPERTVFLQLKPGEPAEREAQNLGVYMLKHEGASFVLGQEALAIALTMARTDALVFPFRRDVLSPQEQKVLATMFSAVAGSPSAAGEPIAFTTHAPSVDGQAPFQSAATFWKSLIEKAGYTPHQVGRGPAGIWGGNPRLSQSGAPCDAVGIVLGDVAVDVAVECRAGLIEFSLLRGSDWLDASVAKMKSLSQHEVRAQRESKLDLEAVDRADSVLTTLEIYIEHQIHYVLQQIVAQMAKAKLTPGSALEIVVCGPSARIPGLQARFEKGIRKVKLPFDVVRVRIPPSPMQTPAAGALIRATLLERKAGAPEAGQSAAAPGRGARISDIFRTATRRLKAVDASALPQAAAARTPQPQNGVQAAAPAPAPAAAQALRPAAAPIAAQHQPPRPPPGMKTSPLEDTVCMPQEQAAGGEPLKSVQEKLRRLEGRVAEIEEKTLGSDADLVEEMRFQAGIGDSRPDPARAQNYRAFFEMMVHHGGSDLFLSAGCRPAMRVDGNVKFVSGDELTRDFLMGMMESVSGQPYRKLFAKGVKGVDLAVEIKGVGRFRANLFHQRGRLAGVFRYIKEKIPSFEELSLPAKTMMKIAGHQRGMVLVTGIAGSGKSTTIASVIEHMNQTSNRHVVTIEDPIEFVYAEKQSIIDQREVGLDTSSFADALKSVVRQSPDVIFIGEMRDRETMEAAISAAETGHLVLSTLHTVNAQQTVERIITYFPPHQHQLIRLQLSMVLVGVLSVRLLLKKGGKGRVPAVEIMLGTPTIKDMLLEGKTNELYAAISQDIHFGNQTFNQSIKGLYLGGSIDLEEALAAADNPDELKLELRGITRGARATDMEM